MTNPLTNLSETKKGVAALFAAVVVGFVIGTMTVVQVGLPSRVTQLEAFTTTISSRVSTLEDEHETAKAERLYILQASNWQSCALEAQNDGENMRAVCGIRPEWTPQ